jgi:uncharacterized iron-regulated protein
MIKLREAALLSFAICLASCAGSGFRGAPFVIIETESGEGLEFEEFINNVADADVVFLGEEHDNTTCHELQRWTTIALAKRREIKLSLEQFEADVQDSLNAYLRGDITEASFLEESRPWPNYEEHYRPTIEWARENGVPVIAANIPRRIARKVSQGAGEELQVLGDEHAPWQMNTDDPPYRARFEEAMGGHGGTVSSDLDDWFAAQCIKDEKMAESIASEIRRSDLNAPLVIHWCGRFHSDYRLGTVSRLAERRPELKIITVSMTKSDELSNELSEVESMSANYVWEIR